MVDRVVLPIQIHKLVQARNELKERYAATNLRFTLDGNLVGDLGEALAHEVFKIRLTKRSSEGIDGYAPDGRSVQIKASGTARGPVFRNTQMRADHLVFFHFDYDNCSAEIVYNGPEHSVIALLPSSWEGQRMASITKVRAANKLVRDIDRLSRI